MTVVANTFRGFLNITASGVLLLIAVVGFNAVTSPPYGRWRLEDGDIVTMGIFAALTCLTAYLAWKFWKHRPLASSSTASFILNGLACLLLIVMFGFYFVRG